MTKAEFFKLLGIADPQGFVDCIVDPLREVYRFNADRHEPDMGDDHQTFGFLVYRNGWARIEVALGKVAGVRTARPKNSLQISVRTGVRFHVYRGGNDENYDILTYDFSTGTETKVSLSTRNAMQLSLFDSEEPGQDNSWQLDELVIVHAGSPDLGLTGVWVGAPIPEATDGSQWAWVLPLYAGNGKDGSRVKDDGPAIAPFDQSPEPDLDLDLHSEIADEDGREAG